MKRLPAGFDYVFMILAAVAYVWFQGWQAWLGINSNDFKHIYLGMKALLDGISPYSFNALHHQAALQGYRQISLNPYVYLPFTGHAMAFLAPLRLEQAVVAWFAVNHLFVAGSLWLISGMWPKRRIIALAFLTLAMAISFPLYRTLTAGQLNLALLFMICAARALLIKGRPGSAGCLLAFAALYKLMPGIFGLYLLLQRRWSAVAAMVAAGVGLLALSTALSGWKISAQFIPVLQDMGYGKSTWPEVFSFYDDPTNQSLNSFFHHILAKNDHTTPWYLWGPGYANGATWISIAFLLSSYLFVIGRQGKLVSQKGLHQGDDLAYCATLILGLLIPSLMWDHYLVMLILPVAVLVRESLDGRRISLLVIIAILYLATSIPWQFEKAAYQNGLPIVLMSMKLWPTLILYGLTLCFTWQYSRSAAPTKATD